MEFGNYPGYFNYRKNAAPTGSTRDDVEMVDSGRCESKCDEKEKSETITEPTDQDTPSDLCSKPLDSGLSDQRIKLLQHEWFSGKDVLDIGCNRGHMTYAVARLFSPKFILGIDIDSKMIRMANRDLHLHLDEGLMPEGLALRQQHAAQLNLNGDSKVYQEPIDHFPLSCYVAQGPIALIGDKESPKFPNNILFVEHNYVVSRDDLVSKQKAHFDTILCLSVTKWVHLNYRDEGLKRFFRRIYNHLRVEGLLILEAQPFDNYARKKKLSDRLRSNYNSIQFKPEHFDEYLLSSEVGFRKILYSTTTDHKCAGFKRPLKVFVK